MHSERIIIGCFLFLIGLSCLYLIFFLGGSDNSNDIERRIIEKRNFYNILPHGSKIIGNSFLPKDWKGLPISINNSMYIDSSINEQKYKAGYNSLKKKLLLMKKSAYDNDDKYWEILLSSHENIIGWNGIFDCVNDVQKTLGIDSSVRLHKLGESLYKHAINPRYAVEVASRDILHKAPLHGCVWKAIEEIGTSNPQKLYDLVNKQLCDFKKVENMGNIWISCAHGVGHGLSNLYGFDGIPDALRICSGQDDPQFQYACATGIYMALEQQTPIRTFYPCDINRYPGACYRFKTRVFNMIFYNETYPCRTQTDQYHEIGCVWGHGYVYGAPPTDYYKVCEQYLPPIHSPKNSFESYRHAACVDGMFAGKEGFIIPNHLLLELCNPVKDYPLSYETCKIYANNNFLEFTFTDEDNFYYNDKILEKYYIGGDGRTTEAQWLPEWDNITMNMQNMPLQGKQQNHHNHGE